MAGHEGPRGFGPQGEWPYSGSGPSGSSETKNGADWLTARRDAESDLPSGQGEEGAPAPTAAELRERLKGIADSTKSSESTGPQNRGQILASLHGTTGTQEAPVSSLDATEVPPTVAEINTKAVEANEKWQTEKELRETLAAVTNAKEQLKALQAEIARAEEYNRAIDPDAVREIAGKMHESLEGVNPYFLNKAATIVGTAAHQDAVVLEGMHKQYNELG